MVLSKACDGVERDVGLSRRRQVSSFRRRNGLFRVIQWQIMGLSAQ